MISLWHVQHEDKPFWFAIDKREFALKVCDKRGYIIRDGDKPIDILRYNLLWDNIPFLTLNRIG